MKLSRLFGQLLQMVVGLSSRLELPQVPASPSHSFAPSFGHLAADLPALARLLHPPSLCLLLHHLWANPPFYGGRGAYNPEAYDVPKLLGRQVAAELVPCMHGLLQCELRGERLVGLRHRRLPRHCRFPADAYRSNLHSRGEGADRETTTRNQERRHQGT